MRHFQVHDGQCHEDECLQGDYQDVEDHLPPTKIRVASSTPVYSDRYGEFFIATWLGAWVPAMKASQAASGWGGDRWEMWTHDDRAVVLLSIRWDSPDDAEEFVNAIDGNPSLRWKRNGDRVAIVAGEAGVDVSEAIDAMLE